jgi:HlyD family secretion protein
MNAPVSRTIFDGKRVPALPGPATSADRPDVGGVKRRAYAVIAGFVAIFVTWGAVAPLNSAAVAPGVLEADGGGRRTVQHLEGGIINRFLVREGQLVKAGQPLVQLDPTQTDARDSAVRTAYATLLAQDARLTAERIAAPGITYPSALLAMRGEPGVASILQAAEAAFATRRRSLVEQTEVLHQRQEQATAEIASNRAQLLSIADQLRSLDAESRSVVSLVGEGLERYSRLHTLERQQATAEQQRSQLTGNIARLQGSLGEANAQIASLKGQLANEAAAQQGEVQMNIVDLREKLKVSGDIQRRQEIVAPVAGFVENLRLITPGAVLTPGSPLLDLVPADGSMLVSARLRANDIDIVHRGLRADVRLTPYKTRVVPLLRGKVREVSADATYDESTHALYYKVKIELDPSELKHLKDVRLVSGMPAEVFIDTGARSLFQYFAQPLLDSFRRAMRET